jgi:hypothetical protein
VIGVVRWEMNDRGFTLVSTPRFCDESLHRRFKWGRTVLTCDSDRWGKYPQLARYASWLEGLLNLALPEEEISLDALEYRREQAGAVDPETDRLHADGSYIRTVYTLFGPSTIYRDGQEEIATPAGFTLLMTAMDRTRALDIPCTLHRRPGVGPERAAIVCSFASGKKRSSQGQIYQRVAHPPSLHGMSRKPVSA